MPTSCALALIVVAFVVATGLYAFALLRKIYDAAREEKTERDECPPKRAPTHERAGPIVQRSGNVAVQGRV